MKNPEFWEENGVTSVTPFSFASNQYVQRKKTYAIFVKNFISK